MKGHTPGPWREISDVTTAMFNESFPINPIPFAIGLADLIRSEGTYAIKSDQAKRILWVLMAQSYGQLATISMMDEWSRLTNDGLTNE